jgi:hypothetical protein
VLPFLVLYLPLPSRIIGTMPKRRAQVPNPHQTAIDLDAPTAQEAETVAPDTVSETAPEYNITTGWIDAAGKQRTWRLNEPTGTKLAEITTKSGAQKIADLLNRATDTKRSK